MPLNSYKPAKFIEINQLNLGPVANWPADGSTYAGFPYQFHVHLNVTAQPQDNPNYNNGFYDGSSINVGDWVFTSGDGFMVKIISIASQNPSFVDCIVEDVDQANTYTDASQSQQAIGNDGPGYLFEVINGFPVVAPIPTSLAVALPPYFTSNLLSRFFKDRTATEVEVSQVAHGFTVGQAIYLQTSGAYALAEANSPTTANVIGVVTNIDVSPDKFMYRPVGPIVFLPMPSGNPGAYVYLSDTTPGGLTTTAPTSNVSKLFIKINSTSGIYIGGQPSTSSSGGGILTYSAPLSGGGGLNKIFVNATGLGITYDQPSAGQFNINIASGVILDSAKISLALADTATLSGVPFALDLKIRYLDGSHNTNTDNTTYPTISFIDKSVLSIGGTQPTLSTPFLYKPLGNSISVAPYSIANNAGVGEAIYRIQQLNFDFCELVLNF